MNPWPATGCMACAASPANAKHALRELHRQGIRPARRIERDRAQEIPGAALNFGAEGLIIQRHHQGRDIGPLAPDDDRAAPAIPGAVAVHGQDGERPGGMEQFVGDEIVAPLVANGADDGGLVVVALGHADAGVAAGATGAPVGGDDQRGADAPEALRGFDVRFDRAGAAIEGFHPRRRKQDDAPFTGDPSRDGAAQIPVLDHEAEGFAADFAGIVMQEKGRVPLGDANVQDWRRVAGEIAPQPGRFQQPLGGQRDGRNPPIGRGPGRRLRVFGVHHRDPQTFRCQRTGQGAAHQPAADDQRIGVDRLGRAFFYLCHDRRVALSLLICPSFPGCFLKRLKNVHI